MNKMKSRLKRLAATLIPLVTIAVFAVYFARHPAVWHQLQRTSSRLLILLVALYLFSFVALALVTAATLRLCRVKVNKLENWLLTSYTAVVNFFGPLQSGPAFRAVYLKTKYDLKLKNYA